MSKTFIIYSRCSTEEQRKKGNSHEYQIREVENFAKRKGMKCLGIFSDTISGTTFSGRNQLDAAYLLCENMQGEINYLLTYKIDRFGRETADALAAIKKFRKIGVEVNFTDEWIDYSDPTHPLVINLKFGLAQTESLKISDRTKDGIYQSQLNGYYPFNPPVGYTKKILESQKANGKHLKLSVPDEKSALVKKVFELFASGAYSKTQLYDQFGERLGISKSPFNELFSNPFYIGEIHLKAYKDNPARIIKAKHEPIITRAIYDRCQRRMQNQEIHTAGKTWTVGSFEDSNYFLKGVLRCDRSGKYMTAYEVRKKSGKRFQYYATPSGKNKRTIPINRAHKIVRKAIEGFEISKDTYQLLREELNAEHKERSHEVNYLLSDSNRVLTREKQRLERAEAQFLDGEIDGKTFMLLREKMVSSIAESEKKLAEYQMIVDNAEQMKYRIMGLLNNLSKIYRQFGITEKNHFLKAAFPDGFFLDMETERVLTRRTNTMLNAICCESNTYDLITIKPDLHFTENPARGGEQFHLLTDLYLWNPVLEAI